MHADKHNGLAIDQGEVVRLTAAFDGVPPTPVRVWILTPGRVRKGPFTMSDEGTDESGRHVFAYDYPVVEAGRHVYGVETEAPVAAAEHWFTALARRARPTPG
jgi:hypothetical protein